MNVKESYTATSIQHLHSIQLCLLCNSVGLGTDGPSNMGTMTISVRVTVASKVGKPLSTCLY